MAASKPNTANIPYLVKHCAISIFKSGRIHSVGKQGFRDSFGIARAQLARQGFLRASSVNGGPENIALTAKGMKREKEHAREGARKSVVFDRLYVWAHTNQKGGARAVPHFPRKRRPMLNRAGNPMTPKQQAAYRAKKQTVTKKVKRAKRVRKAPGL